ncbi:flagellar hook-length control protein FliK [Pontibacterium granulatum]|uniref:flagellar hook-length control protein FliK n=1 Tax=Pontibacterium granulatum TaxID=2036029 RepID=UPI00249BAE61|nr:flagellar hook-length control protein FliK [Pontibacterium granulatum]MDI3322884.1 flagellar hook-length control protein FliK [Pontibacterium granulatum]
MSEQLTNTGVSGLLAMLGAAPAATGQSGAAPAGGVLPFGAIMQAQGAGFNPVPLDANGQSLPQSGGILPPSAEMLAQMQAQIDAKARAPELSQLLAESSDPDLRAMLLTENQSLRDGVVMEPQWPGVLPESSELSLDSPEIVALMQRAFEGHDDAQQRLSEAMGAMQPPAPLAVDESVASLASASGQGPIALVPDKSPAPLNENLSPEVPETMGDVAVVLPDHLQTPDGEALLAAVADEYHTPEQMPGPLVNSETEAKALQQDDEVMNAMAPARVAQNPMAPAELSPESERPELVGLPEGRKSTQRDPLVNASQSADEQVVLQEDLSIKRTAVQAAMTQSAGESPIVDSQGAAAAVMRTNQPARKADSAQGAAASDTVAGSASAKDASNLGAAVTPLNTPGQVQASPATMQAPPGQTLMQDSVQPESRSSTAADATAARQESVDSEAALGAEDDAEGWQRAETGVARQANAAVDNLSRMTPSQAAFTLAGKGQMGSPAWNQALNERVMVMTAQNNQIAEIQLDPPELGSLKVRLHVGQDQVSVSFTSPHASVRDAVEQGMPRLREMMEQQGLNLGESSVNDQSSESGEDGGRQRFASQNDAEGPVGSEEAVSAPVSGEALSLVDYYA